MPSQFVHHLLRPLAVSRPVSPTPSHANDPEIHDEATNRTLRSLLVALNYPLSASLVQSTIESLKQLRDLQATDVDTERNALNRAIIYKLIIGLYSECVDTCLSQANDAETESEWWIDIERSRWNIFWYLLQTTPSRLVSLGGVILRTLRAQNLPFTLSNISLQGLFLSPDPYRGNALTKALFPHLRRQSFSVTSSAVLLSSSMSIGGSDTHTGILSVLTPLLSWVGLPLELTRQECHIRRKALEKIRDQKAEILGRLAQMRGDLAIVSSEPSNAQPFVSFLSRIVEGKPLEVFTSTSSLTQSRPDTLSELTNLSRTIFVSQKTIDEHMLTQHLRRPSQFTLIWPQLLLLPPLCLYALRSAYTSRASLMEVVDDTQETIKGFVRGWLIDPLKDVLKTVRTGGEDGVIVRREGVVADSESLERMALSLAKDELNYRPDQLDALSKQIKHGNLTPVLQLYEEDIKTPLKSAITGTLLRSVFIQVQKAKVDIDQALAGIDKLLKSQELTFAFVGVAPALGIVYLLGGSVLTLVRGGSGRGKYGGKRKIGVVWSAMRRIERLLVSQPKVHLYNDQPVADSYISPLTSGLLLLSVARLRTFAETYLPARSRLREGFLEDVVDLENPDLGRAEKMRVVERMWRCWGEVLGLGRVAVEGSGR